MGKVFQVDPNDPRNDIHFTDYVLELADNQDELERLQKNLKRKAEQRFSPETILREWDKKVFK
jgi:hypothetical protein